MLYNTILKISKTKKNQAYLKPIFATKNVPYRELIRESQRNNYFKIKPNKFIIFD